MKNRSKIRSEIAQKIYQCLNEGASPRDSKSTSQLQAEIRKLLPKILVQNPQFHYLLNNREFQEEMINYLTRLGPIEKLLADDQISEIMINGPKQVYVERSGMIQKYPLQFESSEELRKYLLRIVTPLGRRLDDSSPMVDARLPDGSRVNAAIAPVSLNGPILTIRKFQNQKLGPKQLIQTGSITAEAMAFLKLCVKAKRNLLISGGTGSGKTTLLNCLSGFIAPTERIITIEDSAELKLQQDHVISLESKAKNIEGKGEITIRDLLKNSLRMRPDRIVVGECRGSEILDMLQAMNTGHEGSLTTVHANSPRDTLYRIENMVLISGLDIPISILRDQISSSLHMIVQVKRAENGQRRITHITEVGRSEGNSITLQDIFKFDGSSLNYTKRTPLFCQNLEPQSRALFIDFFQKLNRSCSLPS